LSNVGDEPFAQRFSAGDGAEVWRDVGGDIGAADVVEICQSTAGQADVGSLRELPLAARHGAEGECRGTYHDSGDGGRHEHLCRGESGRGSPHDHGAEPSLGRIL
jgi:hypothetical protein